MHQNMLAPILAITLVGLTMTLAGCTGQFDINQTEPFRVQIEDEEPRTVEVRADDEEPQRIEIENAQGVQEIDVEVTATAISAGDGPVTILITVIDGDTEEVFVEREIVIGEDRNETAGNETEGNETSGNETGGNETDDGNGFFDDQEDDEVTQIIQNVNIRGKNNIVVLAQSVDGDAEVEIITMEAKGQGSNKIDGNATDDNNTTSG